MNIEDIRGEIDRIDEDLLGMFLKRMTLMKDVAGYKNEHDLPTADRTHERESLARLTDKAAAMGHGDLEEYVFYFFPKLWIWPWRGRMSL